MFETESEGENYQRHHIKVTSAPNDIELSINLYQKYFSSPISVEVCKVSYVQRKKKKSTAKPKLVATTAITSLSLLPAAITPAPVTPAPVTPAPVTPAPVTPAPVAPAVGVPAAIGEVSSKQTEYEAKLCTKNYFR